MRKLICIIFMLSIAIFTQGCSASSHSEPNMNQSTTTTSENERNDLEEVYRKYRLDMVGITPLLRHTWDNAGQIQPRYLYDFYRATGMWEYLQQHSSEQGDWVQIPQDQVEDYIERYFETDASAMRGALHELQLYDESEESYLFFVAQFSGEPPRLSNVDSDHDDLILQLDFGDGHLAALAVSDDGKYLSYKYDNQPYQPGITDEDTLDALSADYQLPLLGVLKILGDSWENANQIPADLLVQFYEYTELSPQLQQASIAENTEKIEVKQELVEASIQRHFDVEVDTIRRATQYHQANGMYSFALPNGIGGSAPQLVQAVDAGDTWNLYLRDVDGTEVFLIISKAGKFISVSRAAPDVYYGWQASLASENP